MLRFYAPSAAFQTWQSVSCSPWASLAAESFKMQYMIKLLTPDEVAGGLQCSTKTVFKLARAGTLPSIRVGDLWRFDPDAIRRWIEGASSQAA
ncbi:MAG: helix-turn-helix domain-containing protein [Acidobacteriaceae bacterium]